MSNSNNENDDYRLWLAQEKKSLADAGYQENQAAFDRLKNRTFALLGVSITLCTGSFAGAFSGRDYAFVCAFMAIGFMFVAGCCAAGLYTSKWQTKNVEGEIVDLLVSDLPSQTKIHGTERMAEAVNAVNMDNDGSLRVDRKWLKLAWIILLLTPLIATFFSIIARLPG